MTPSGQALAQIAKDIWESRVEDNPGKAMMAGLEIKKLPAVTFAEMEHKAAFARLQTRRLGELDQGELTRQEQIICQTLAWDLEREQDLDWWWYQFEVTPYASPLSDVQRAMSGMDLSKTGQRENYLRLLNDVGSMLANILGKLQEQHRRGINLPQDELATVESFLTGFMADGAGSLFWVGEARLQELGDAERTRFQQQVGKLIQQVINPQLQKLIAYLGGDYKDSSSVRVGLGQYPGGNQAYEQLIAGRVSLRLAPEAVHAMGLQAVDELNEKMAEVRARLGFSGTKAEFHEKLKHDPRFYAHTPEEVGERLMGYMARLKPQLGAVFSHLPRASYDVKRLPTEYEQAVTFGFYEPPAPSQPVGYYYYNGSDLENRPMFYAAGLIYHELAPGHHFQVARQMENKELPIVSRLGFHMAYVEGWAEYAADLAGELGLYADPYDYYGRLAMHMFTAVRLVVDSGMNALGWSRERARQFMRANILESETQINSETLRYSVDIPAQALAYKIGHIKIHELREQYKLLRGGAYDIRVFHEKVLKYGSMPLQVLEWHTQTDDKELP